MRFLFSLLMVQLASTTFWQGKTLFHNFYYFLFASFSLTILLSLWSAREALEHLRQLNMIWNEV